MWGEKKNPATLPNLLSLLFVQLDTCVVLCSESVSVLCFPAQHTCPSNPRKNK